MPGYISVVILSPEILWKCTFALFRLLFLSTDHTNNRNLISYSFLSGNLNTLHDTKFGISTHVSVDPDNKMIYWIHYTQETSYTVYRTTYSGQTISLFTGKGDSRNIDVTVGMDSFYILDSAETKITRYKKNNNSKISILPVGATTKRIVLIEGMLISQCVMHNDSMPSPRMQ